MTITHNPDSASVLYFSREELQDAKSPGQGPPAHPPRL